MHHSIFLVTIPPGHTPGDLKFFSFLAVRSPPLGTKKETIPHPQAPDRPQIHFLMLHHLDSNIRLKWQTKIYQEFYTQ